jgi:predicted secreted protein
MTTLAGQQTRRLNADTFELTTGITFGVWKKK